MKLNVIQTHFKKIVTMFPQNQNQFIFEKVVATRSFIDSVKCNI